MNERALLPVTAGLALALTMSLAGPVAAAAGVDIDRRLADCAGLGDPSDRLACFESIAADRAAARASRTPPPAPPPPPREQRPAQRPAESADAGAADSATATEAGSGAGADPAEPGASAEDAAFGAEMLARPDDEAGDRRPQQISAQLLRVEKQPYGEQVFYLSNDQVWMELAPGRGLYRQGQTVTVRRALMGGYMLQADGVRAARVRRIR